MSDATVGGCLGKSSLARVKLPAWRAVELWTLLFSAEPGTSSTAPRQQQGAVFLSVSKPCPVTTARKMFPKRKRDESTSGGESQKEEDGAKDEPAQWSKRPRVESCLGGGGTATSPARHEASAAALRFVQ